MRDLVLPLLKSRYEESHRRYHTLDHIKSMLAEFDQTRASMCLSLAEETAVELAILFHDVIYNPKLGDNEERSAELMERTMIGVVSDRVLDLAYKMILATAGHDAKFDVGCYFLDLDLAILGAPIREFEKYDLAIRDEYSFVPEADYKAGRRRVLLGFLERPTIYLTPQFQHKYEEKARANLRRAIDLLA